MALYIANDKSKEPASVGIPVRLLSWVRDHGYADGEGAYAFLRHALDFSAPVTHPEGNKRYDDLLMLVVNNRVVELSVLQPDCSTCNDTKKFKVEEEDGTVRYWPCPDCRVDKRQSQGQNKRLNKSRR